VSQMGHKNRFKGQKLSKLNIQWILCPFSPIQFRTFLSTISWRSRFVVEALRPALLEILFKSCLYLYISKEINLIQLQFHVKSLQLKASKKEHLLQLYPRQLQDRRQNSHVLLYLEIQPYLARGLQGA
jgi:hypothetical protein